MPQHPAQSVAANSLPRSRVCQGLLSYREWKSLFRTDCLGKRPEFKTLGESNLRMLYENGLAPTVSAVSQQIMARQAMGMTKRKTIAVLPTSPLTLMCPLCKAKPGRDCSIRFGNFSAVHVARIRAADLEDELQASPDAAIKAAWLSKTRVNNARILLG
jgi:hypothetical protein